MKKYTAFFLIFSLILCMCGCRANVPEGSNPSTKPTQTQSTGTNQPQAGSALDILSAIWDQYPENLRFDVYGGMMSTPVNNAPGNLNLSNKNEITSKYLIPEDKLSQIQSGASLVHLMNSNLFTAAVFQLNNNASAEEFARAVREAVQKNRWICGQPDKLLITQPQNGYVLISFGSDDAMGAFTNYAKQVFPQGKIFYNEAIVA